MVIGAWYSVMTVLTATDDWSQYYARFAHLDVYYAQEYVQTAAWQEPDSTPFAVYYECHDARVWYPFLLRDIPGFTGYTDIVNAYGYGGPHLEGNPDSIVDFYREFVNEFGKSHNVVTETVRLHPLTENHQIVRRVMEVLPVRTTVAVDLVPAYEDIFAGYRKDSRQSVRRSINGFGVTFEEQSGDEAVDTFMKLYTHTMERNDAHTRYFFTRDYIARMMTANPLCTPVMLVAFYEGTAIGARLGLLGSRYAHAYLTGIDEAHFKMRANHSLLDQSVQYFKRAGASLYHLGGGYREGDGVYQFKLQFSPGNTRTFWIGRHVMDAAVYKEIVSQLTLPDGGDDYFPPYRNPVAFGTR